MTGKRKTLKLNNKGSAIVTVLIVIIFVSILATTVLYLTGRNTKMKATDRDIKESFYETEKTVEEIKAGLVRIVSLSYEEAYIKVMSEYASYSGSGRKALFCEAFTDAFIKRWRTLSNGCADLATNPSNVTNTPTPDPNPSGASGLDESDKASGKLYIRDVIVKGTLDRYTTIIETDFAIVCPDVSFDVNYDTIVPDAPSGNPSINVNDCVMYINWEKR
ncbi:MAG: pilus assembly PilX N-terminal domain-containing protein [Lachnospiraceae bacterium]|nr:pilus assembly PilX N-terminal domain-containing protein [Lachnospiraceae bacterium]